MNIEKNKDIDSIIFDELIRSLWIYEMSLTGNQKPWEVAFKASKNEAEKTRNFKFVGMKELVLMSKQIKDVMRFQKRLFRKQDSKKGKRIEIILRKRKMIPLR